MKGKIFQIALRDEIKIEQSTSQRSMTTGHLLITMPKLNYKAPIRVDKPDDIFTDGNFIFFFLKTFIPTIHRKSLVGCEKSNHSQTISKTVDYKNIVNQSRSSVSEVIEDNEIPHLI